MDKSIPAGAAILLRFIYKTEVSKAEPDCYEVIYGNRQSGLVKPITQMTIAEIQAAQRTWSTQAWAKKFGSTKASSATGAAQFMRATLAELVTDLKLSTSMLFTGDLQDRLAYHLLKRRGYLDFISGKISRTEFGRRLSQEWASFPVLAPTQGSQRKLTRGQSFYAGDGLNKALVKPEAVEAILDQVKAAGNRNQEQVLAAIEPEPEPGPFIVDAVNPADKLTDKPAPAVEATTPVANAVAFSGFAAALAAGGYMISEWFSAQTCNLVGLLCGG